MADEVDLKEFISGFLVEAEEHLAAAHRALLAVEQALGAGQVPARQIRELFRALHTIKGLAAMVGIDPIVDLSHELESVLRDADRAGGRLSPAAVDWVFRGVRAVEERVKELAAGQSVSPAPRALLDGLSALRDEGSEAGTEPSTEVLVEDELIGRLTAGERAQVEQGLSGNLRALRIDFEPNPERMQAGLNITSVRERLSGLGELVKVIPRSIKATAEAPGGLSFALLLLTHSSNDAVAERVGLPPSCIRALHAARVCAPAPGLPAEPLAAAEEALEAPAASRRGVVRVDVERLDDSMEKLSAVLVTRHRLERAVKALAQRGADTRELSAIMQEAARQLRDLRASIMSVRMVPVAQVLERVPLIVRGLQKSTGKPLRLELELGDTELDKAVGDRILPAIIHLLRNAVDHGVEAPEERARANKPPEATLRVSANAKSHHQLELRVSDDGRGIDPAQVAKKAGGPEPRTPAELLALLTRPGFSTRNQADKTSGRGMGMDIVRKVVVEQLGGALDVETALGQGTSFILRVPLSVTIVDAFTFEVGPERFAVPVGAVEEIIEVAPEQLLQTPSPRKGARALPLLERRGVAMTFYALDRLFGSAQAPQSLRKAIVIRRDGEPLAFGVSRMLGQQEIVVRALEDPLVRVSGVTGATDLGDGRPTLVLDLSALGANERSVW